MNTKKSRKFQILTGLIAVLVLGAGCRGFFVNPTLTSVAVGPGTVTLIQGNTQQMTATGHYNDNITTKDLTGQANWSSSDPTKASVNSTGLVTGVSQGSATISASFGTVSPGSASVTVTLANIVSILVTPTNSSKKQGETEQFTATATTSDGTTHDISNAVTWASSNANAGTVNATGLFTAAASVTSTQAAVITATSSNNVASPSTGPQAATVTVSP